MEKDIIFPVWVKSKTGGVAIQFADGSLASAEQVKNLIFWPSVRLRIYFGGWYRYYKSDWQKQVVAFIAKLINLEKFSWMHQETDPIRHWTAAVLRPKPFHAADVKKWLEKNIFKSYPEDPLLLLRTGKEFNTYYDVSLLIRHDSVEFFLPPSEKNVKLLEKLLDDYVQKNLAAKISFQFADISFGLNGWLYPFTQIAKNATFMMNPEKNSPVYGASWRLYIGDLWRATDKHRKVLGNLKSGVYKKEEHKNFLFITTPKPRSPEDAKGASAAKKLHDDFDIIKKKMVSLDQKLLQPIIDKEEKVLLEKLRKRSLK